MKLTRKVITKELMQIMYAGLAGIIFSLILYDVNVYSLAASAVLWIALSKGNGYLVDYLNWKISWVEKPITRVIVGTVVMLVYTVVAFAIVIAGANWLVSGRNIMDMVRQIALYDFLIAILITLIISMFFHGRAFYLNWKKALIREEKLKNETLRTQYESLKNQVNPHFLFNSLNALSSLVYDDQKKAVAFIRKMADVYRYVLEKKDQELVPVEEELQFAKNYAYLQQIRFGDNFRLEITETSLEGYVPPLAIQLLVENAIKHNIVSESKPLCVTITTDGKHIRVENNIQEKHSKDSTGIGLGNLKSRYGYLSDKVVKIHSDSEYFRVLLPVLKLN